MSWRNGKSPGLTHHVCSIFLELQLRDQRGQRCLPFRSTVRGVVAPGTMPGVQRLFNYPGHRCGVSPVLPAAMGCRRSTSPLPLTQSRGPDTWRGHLPHAEGGETHASGNHRSGCGGGNQTLTWVGFCWKMEFSKEAGREEGVDGR